MDPAIVLSLVSLLVSTLALSSSIKTMRKLEGLRSRYIAKKVFATYK